MKITVEVGPLAASLLARALGLVPSERDAKLQVDLVRLGEEIEERKVDEARLRDVLCNLAEKLDSMIAAKENRPFFESSEVFAILHSLRSAIPPEVTAE